MNNKTEKLDSGVNVGGDLKFGHDQSINWGHREKIFQKVDPTIVEKFFGEAINMQGFEFTIGHGNNGRGTIQVCSTSKIIVIYGAKHASAFIDDVLHKKIYHKHAKLKSTKPLANGVANLRFKPFSSEIDETDDINYGLGEETIKELVTFTKNKSKLDLIIVVRNPIYKLISGLLQDLESHLNNNFVVSGLIKSLFKELDTFSNETSIGDLPPKVVAELFYKYVNELYSQTGSLKGTHTTLHNEAIWNFLEHYPKIPLDKVKIVDIDDTDSSLGDLLTDYHDEISDSWKKKLFKSHRPKWVNLLTELNDYINLKGDKTFKKKLKEYCYQDFNYYSKLTTKYKDCFVKAETE